MADALIPTRTIRRTGERTLTTIEADICVLGAGISGVSAALEAAKLGRKVVIVDGAPALGGQAIG
jgi:heterodisulfide reductase subunit A-like polyferredoxin